MVMSFEADIKRAAKPTEAGVTKVYRQGSWVDPTKPPSPKSVTKSRKLPGAVS